MVSLDLIWGAQAKRAKLHVHALCFIDISFASLLSA